MSLLRLTAPVTATAAALLVFAVPASATPDPEPLPEPVVRTIVVQLCVAVTVPSVDEVLDQLDDTDLVGQLAPLAPITVPEVGDPLGLDLDVTADVDDVHAVLNCGTVTPPPATSTPPTTTTPPPPTTTAPSTEVPTPTASATPAPTTTAPADEGDDGITQVRVTPQGGVATGDGSLAP